MNKKSHPAENIEEWIKSHGYDVWPEPSDAKYTPLEKEKDMLGSKEYILEELRKHASFPMYMLERLENKADILLEKLNVYASKIITVDATSNRHKDNLFHSPNNIMKRAAESDAVIAHRGKLRDKNHELRTLILGSKARSVEATRYSGYSAHELNDLPHGLEAPQILDRITKAQSFNSGFEKFWKKLFLSEASTAVMQDTFWWFFIDKFEPKKKSAKKKLFNRIADSFVALFVSVNPEIKDKFFTVYSDCLAQALFAAYLDAFTDSHKVFDDQFKQDLVSCVSDWVAGVKAPPLAWKHWDIKKLRPKGLNEEKEEDKKKVVLIKDGKINYDADFSIEIAQEEETGIELDPGLSREPTMMAGKSNKIPPIGTAAVPSTRLPTAMPLRESHKTGPGPDFERVLFNIGGRSPLVAHYLYVKGLTSNENHGRQVRRTEISRIQSHAPTYRDVIKNTKKTSRALNAEYQRISESTAKDIAFIERQQVEQVREIENLKQQIVHHSIDMKILSERILDLRGYEGILALLNKERQISLPEKKVRNNRVDMSSDDSYDEDWLIDS
ncbi:protein FAM227B-like isoform X2 [Anneissia japonica]|uniref:protein FAM227B-like isoform X2 n=1 Tax=Anneissia japonica TaxID=1529436 RepID=UPI0014255206|nr:protein FAM227B-like isoform X2 [Anneissia japonica]